MSPKGNGHLCRRRKSVRWLGGESDAEEEEKDWHDGPQVNKYDCLGQMDLNLEMFEFSLLIIHDTVLETGYRTGIETELPGRSSSRIESETEAPGRVAVRMRKLIWLSDS